MPIAADTSSSRQAQRSMTGRLAAAIVRDSMRQWRAQL